MRRVLAIILSFTVGGFAQNFTFEDLIKAIVDGNPKADTIIISQIVDINERLRPPKFQNGRDKTPLMIASNLGYRDIVKSLIESGAYLNLVDADGLTALMYAASSAKYEVIQELLDSNAKVNIKDSQNYTALMYAVNSKKSDPLDVQESVELLIEAGSDIETKNINGDSALILASNIGNLNVVKLLVDSGANVNGKNRELKTPLMIASESGAIEIMRYLIENNASIKEQDRDGNTPLLLSIRENNSEAVELLLNSKADTEFRNNFGESALLKSILVGDWDIFKLILQRCKDINIRDYSNQKTPLIIATEFGYFNFVKELLKQEELDIDAVDKDRESAIVKAIRNGDSKLVQLLLNSKGRVNLNIPNSNQKTPILIAIDKLVQTQEASYIKALDSPLIKEYKKIIEMLLDTEMVDLHFRDAKAWKSINRVLDSGYNDIAKKLMHYQKRDIRFY